jgi:signal transduction histidine kinase
MGTIVICTAAALGVLLLILRERAWRGTCAELRARLADAALLVGEQERRAHVTQVVSGLAQELKSPLQGVLGNTELMLASGTLSPASTDDLRQIQENATRAAGIVRNLLAFTETHALSRRWQEINELAIRAADGARGELGAAGVQVRFALADRLPLMYVDGRQLEKVIATLLSRPVLRGAGLPSPSAVTLVTRRGDTDDRLVIDVDDGGAETDVDEPAWSGDLAACRQIVQAHGGTLEVERSANGGFRFHLELPVTAAGADAAAAT